MGLEFIIDNYNSIRKVIDDYQSNQKRSIKLISVSKTHPFEYIKFAFENGINDFGENYVQELVNKYEQAKNLGIEGINWHLIGHLQTNKVKYIAPFIDCIHSVDTFKLANEVNKHAEKHNRVIDILLQVNTSNEESKSGCNVDEIEVLFKQCKQLPFIKVKGLMTIAGLNEEISKTKEEFAILKQAFDNLNINGANLTELSMGMSGDFKVAIEMGSTMVRVGTGIFGNRNYAK